MSASSLPRAQLCESLSEDITTQELGPVSYCVDGGFVVDRYAPPAPPTAYKLGGLPATLATAGAASAALPHPQFHISCFKGATGTAGCHFFGFSSIPRAATYPVMKLPPP